MGNRPISDEARKARVAKMWLLAEKQGGVISFGQYREIAKDNGAVERSLRRYQEFEIPKLVKVYEMRDRARQEQVMKIVDKSDVSTIKISQLFDLWKLSDKGVIYEAIDRIVDRYSLTFPAVIDDRKPGYNGYCDRFQAKDIEIDFTSRDQHAHPAGILCSEPRRLVDWEINKETGECWIAMVM